MMFLLPPSPKAELPLQPISPPRMEGNGAISITFPVGEVLCVLRHQGHCHLVPYIDRHFEILQSNANGGHCRFKLQGNCSILGNDPECRAFSTNSIYRDSIVPVKCCALTGPVAQAPRTWRPAQTKQQSEAGNSHVSPNHTVAPNAATRRSSSPPPAQQHERNI